MSRTERLLHLVQLLRRHRYAVSGAVLAEELGISLRSLYRDIATLKAQGARIEGESGVGYMLRPGFTIPPLMFSADEIEAIVLGSRWVAKRGDPRLALAAKDALAKIAAVLPPELRDEVDAAPLMVGPSTANAARNDVWMATLRHAMRIERKVVIRYRNERGDETERLLSPFAIGFFDNVQLVVAWCDLRNDFRSFRIDRILHVDLTGEEFARRRRDFLRDWRRRENIPEQ